MPSTAPHSREAEPKGEDNSRHDPSALVHDQHHAAPPSRDGAGSNPVVRSRSGRILRERSSRARRSERAGRTDTGAGRFRDGRGTPVDSRTPPPVTRTGSQFKTSNLRLVVLGLVVLVVVVAILVGSRG
jgi:hypothetical protein